MNRRWELLRCIVEVTYTLSITVAAMKWSSYMAYVQRGYEAVGSEYFFAGIAGYIAYRAIDILFETLEEEIYAAVRCRKKRSRGAVRNRN